MFLKKSQSMFKVVFSKLIRYGNTERRMTAGQTAFAQVALMVECCLSKTKVSGSSPLLRSNRAEIAQIVRAHPFQGRGRRCKSCSPLFFSKRIVDDRIC